MRSQACEVDHTCGGSASDVRASSASTAEAQAHGRHAHEWHCRPSGPSCTESSPSVVGVDPVGGPSQIKRTRVRVFTVSVAGLAVRSAALSECIQLHIQNAFGYV